VAHNLVSEKAKIQNKVKTVTKTLKQANEENNLEAVEMLTNIKEQHIQSIEQIDNQIKKDNYDKYIKRNKRNLSTGIDPGVKAIVALDNGALFNPNIKRERIEVHIAQLQNELKKVQLINDKQHQGDERRKKTNNEIKLQQKISRLHERAANSSNAFNHKLSTRIVRTYATMSIEDTQVKNMVKKATPVLSGEFDGYEKNNASAKTGLNNSLKTRCIGDLKAKIKSKAEVSGANFVASPAKNSSLKCPTCGVVGKKEEVRTQQHLFVCHNEKCSDYKVEKQADINAAINHRLAAGITEKPILKYNIQQLEYKRPIKFKKKKNESLDKKRVDGL
jgi:transposase